MIIRNCKTPSKERRLSTTGIKIAACKPNEKFFRPLGSSSLHVNSPWVYKQVFPLIITGVLKLNKNGVYVRQLLCSLSFWTLWIETMVISNARNNPCPFSNLSNHFDIHSIFNLCLITLSTDLFWNWRKGKKFTYSVSVPFFYRSRTAIFVDLNLRNFLESAILLFPNIRDPRGNFMSHRKAKNLNIRRTNIN